MCAGPSYGRNDSSDMAGSLRRNKPESDNDSGISE
jgi:hypothetical protein